MLKILLAAAATVLVGAVCRDTCCECAEKGIDQNSAECEDICPFDAADNDDDDVSAAEFEDGECLGLACLGDNECCKAQSFDSGNEYGCCLEEETCTPCTGDNVDNPACVQDTFSGPLTLENACIVTPTAEPTAATAEPTAATDEPTEATVDPEESAEGSAEVESKNCCQQAVGGICADEDSCPDAQFCCSVDTTNTKGSFICCPTAGCEAAMLESGEFENQCSGTFEPSPAPVFCTVDNCESETVPFNEGICSCKAGCAADDFCCPDYDATMCVAETAEPTASEVTEDDDDDDTKRFFIFMWLCRMYGWGCAM